MFSDDIVPVPIRADWTVSIGPIPRDLTKAEADKIANVIRAYGGCDGR